MPTVKMNHPAVLMSGYNHWANTQFVNYFRTQEAGLIEKFIPGSFPSIRKTLMHIWDAQDLWYRRLHGESPQLFMSRSWAGSIEEMYKGILSSSQDFVDLLHAVSDLELQESINYNTTSTGGQSNKRFEIFLHVFNHSSYHRGQCVTMARTLDMQNIPSTDLIHYLRHQSSTGQ